MLNEEIMEKSFESVTCQSRYVSINFQNIKSFVSDFFPVKIVHWSNIYPLGYQRRKKDEDEIDFLFLIGSLAFCFWGYPKKWTVNYKGKLLDGWWALIACCERALDDELSLLDGEYLANLSLKDTRKIFNGKPEIPLLKERIKILNKIGETLINKYESQFHNFYLQQKKEAYNLIEKIADEFYGFNDIVMYHGTKVLLYKKAQVVLSDIHEIFKGKGYGNIKNMDKLPGHADYKIPAILRQLHILEYNQELANKIDNRIEIPAGSKMEIEIRANMLCAIQEMCEKLKGKYPNITPTKLCGILWTQSQNNTLRKPYHLTKTIFY